MDAEEATTAPPLALTPLVDDTPTRADMPMDVVEPRSNALAPPRALPEPAAAAVATAIAPPLPLPLPLPLPIPIPLPLDVG